MNSVSAVVTDLKTGLEKHNTGLLYSADRC